MPRYSKRLGRSDYKLLARAKRARMKQTILSTVRRAVIGARGSQASITDFGPTYADADMYQLRNRAKWGFRGKGKYSLGKFIRDAGNLGEGIKRTYNSWIPKSLREQGIGIASQKLAAFGGGGLYTGRGAYTANELVDGGMMASSMSGSGDETEAICMSNREYVSDIYAPDNTAFNNTSYMINPGMQMNFPFLAQIAANYEEYEFQKLIFMYRATVDIGNTVTNGQTGTIIMACDYNASHSPFVSKDQMMTYHGAVSGKATEDIVCGIECDPAKGKTLATYVRTSPVPYGEDPKTYDLGKFQLALNNIPAAMFNQQLGELWVEYTCVLRKPKLSVSRGVTIQKDIYLSGDSSTGRAPDLRTATAIGPAIDRGALGAYAFLLKSNFNNLGTLLSYYTPFGDDTTGGRDWTATGQGSMSPATFGRGGLITFPASYSGFVRIVYRASVRNPVTALDVPFSIRTNGNVRVVNDIWAAQGTQVPTYTAQALNINTDWFFFESHFDIKPATGGINNEVLLIPAPAVSTGSTGAEFWNMSIEIEESNPTFIQPTDAGTWLSLISDQVDIPLQ